MYDVIAKNISAFLILLDIFRAEPRTVALFRSLCSFFFVDLFNTEATLDNTESYKLL